MVDETKLNISRKCIIICQRQLLYSINTQIIQKSNSDKTFETSAKKTAKSWHTLSETNKMNVQSHVETFNEQIS